jgi:hypothetical protein
MLGGEPAVNARGAEGTQAVTRAFTAREPAGEESIYRALTGICECVISVSHRPSLIKYHQSHLELNGSEGWALQDVGVKEGEPGGGAFVECGCGVWCDVHMIVESACCAERGLHVPRAETHCISPRFYIKGSSRFYIRTAHPAL